MALHIAQVRGNAKAKPAGWDAAALMSEYLRLLDVAVPSIYGPRYVNRV